MRRLRLLAFLPILLLSGALSATDTLKWTIGSYQDANGQYLTIHSNQPGKAKTTPYNLTINVVADPNLPGAYYGAIGVPALTRTYQVKFRGQEQWLHVSY